MQTKLYDIATRKSKSYYELCPQTPMLFLSPDHLLKTVTTASWPNEKPVYLMAPSVDFNTKTSPRPANFTRTVMELTDVVLCRTMRCDQDIKHFLMRQIKDSDEESSELIKNTRVLYTSQVTVDPANFARKMLDGDATPQNAAGFAYTRFAHTTWRVSSKTTQDVFNCWKGHKKELPPLDVYLLRAIHENKQNDAKLVQRDGRRSPPRVGRHDSCPSFDVDAKYVLDFEPVAFALIDVLESKLRDIHDELEKRPCELKGGKATAFIELKNLTDHDSSVLRCNP
ncbi:hypothetical protein PPTG_18196 [Phytophthora nicotianae INRA-310]|uniref:Uncharacterized protein n=1 Tax=Phytophthora nicotianae (strain INRA-310) TaxID=761204 RepID=W2PJI9_PHYN3|nr:hypothetical protein PPTG_18196 [Phytophthora nicotianae INRA-310]ETN00195.1 hypothetical protein PPTG_18196 [Phytophthora nicotianae INRA-310]